MRLLNSLSRCCIRSPRPIYLTKSTAQSALFSSRRNFPVSNNNAFDDAFMGDNIVNFYAGQPPLNRLSFQRGHVSRIREHLDAKDARFLLFKDFKPLMRKGEPGQLLFLQRDAVEPLVQKGFVEPTPAELEVKERARILESARVPHTLPALVFLGIDDRQHASTQGVPMSVDPSRPEGVPYFALEATEDFEVEGGIWEDARNSASAMDGWTAGIFAQGRALIDWNVRNKFCAACGSPTYSLWAGWKRSCTTALEPIPGKTPCFSLQGLHNFAYPRTDPVIIMGILDSTGDKMLLGRQSKWPKGMYSCLAGFIEPGESFEDAVRREVLEEAGIEVGPVRYSSSQPWPYPANLMVGCFGRAKDGQTIRLDLDNELEDAQWFSRAEIINLVGSGKGSSYTSKEMEQLTKNATLHHHEQKSAQETSNALAPSERKEGEGNTGGSGVGLTRVPPDTAIAGQLVRLWARGDLDLVSKL